MVNSDLSPILLTHQEINFLANSPSPLKQTQSFQSKAFSPFQWTFAISLGFESQVVIATGVRSQSTFLPFPSSLGVFAFNLSVL